MSRMIQSIRFKEYASFTDFMKELTSQLRSPDYQQFFSRFVAQKDHGKFFARVRERFTTFTWTQREPLDMGPWWRETAVENANAEPDHQHHFWRSLAANRSLAQGQSDCGCAAHRGADRG